MKKYFFILLAIGCCYLPGCSKDTELGMAEGIDVNVKSKYVNLTKAQKELTSSANTFAFDLFNQIRSSREKDETILLSPFSASMALGMAATGAEGETERQMRTVLGFESASKEEIASYYSKMISGLAEADPYVDLKIANSIWIDKYFPVKEDYINSSEKSFNSEVENRDFSSPSALEDINKWVEKKTDGTIKELLDELNPDAMMVLANALAFEGKWRYSFAGTKKAPFNNVSGGKKRTDMMYATGELNYSSRDGWEMLCLPYGAGTFSMYIILPPAGNDFSSIKMDEDRWKTLYNTLSIYDVNVHIPAFITNDSHDLIGPLKALGMTEPFSNADFSGITDESIRIGKVDQKTFIEVNETGTKASAATAVTFMAYSTGVDPGEIVLESANFDADRPFFYIIHERSTDAILFIGQVTEL